MDVLQSQRFLHTIDTQTTLTTEFNSKNDIQKHSYCPSDNIGRVLNATQIQVISGLIGTDSILHTIQLQETESSSTLLNPILTAVINSNKSSFGKESFLLYFPYSFLFKYKVTLSIRAVI